jgi:hypothetical protein
MRMEMQYIGACHLLGRLANKLKDDDDKYCVKRALDDCAAAFPGRFEVIKTSGGWSLEPVASSNAPVQRRDSVRCDGLLEGRLLQRKDAE